MQSARTTPRSPVDNSNLRRIAWITPDYPPDRGGVSDHSHEMVKELRAMGHEVLVCARPHEHGFDRADAELAAFRPDLVVVAYTPLGYAPRTGGIAPALTRWALGLRRRFRCHAILMAHEVSLPAGLHWQNREWKLCALGTAQMAQFALLAASFDAVLFSNLGTLQIWAKLCPRRAHRFHTLRICSNIPYEANADPAAALTALGYSVPAPTILFFGTGHQSVLFDYVEEAFLELLRVEPYAGLVIVGMTADKLRQLRPSLAARAPQVRALGYTAAEQLSLWLQVSSLVLAPQIEGVSARKGTVMAALQHGRAVLTTHGAQTREDIVWDAICLLAPLDRAAFATAAVQAFREPARRAAVGNAARAEYEAHASASVTAAQILAHAQRHGGSDRWRNAPHRPSSR